MNCYSFVSLKLIYILRNSVKVQQGPTYFKISNLHCFYLRKVDQLPFFWKNFWIQCSFVEFFLRRYLFIDTFLKHPSFWEIDLKRSSTCFKFELLKFRIKKYYFQKGNQRSLINKSYCYFEFDGDLRYYP